MLVRIRIARIMIAAHHTKATIDHLKLPDI